MSDASKKPRGRPKADQTMKQIALRVDVDTLDAVEALVVAAEKANPLMKTDRSTILRVALQKGVEALNKELGLDRRGGKK